MKKLIAILICSIPFSTFTWNVDFLKPNFSSWYQSWSNLPSNQQNLLIGASVGTVLGIVYIGWPVSERVARDKAVKEFKATKKRVEMSDDKEKIISQKNFPFGSCFTFDRPFYRITTTTYDIESQFYPIVMIASFDSKQVVRAISMQYFQGKKWQNKGNGLRLTDDELN